MTEIAPQEPTRPVPPELQGGRGGLKFCLFGVLMAFAALLITIGLVFMDVRKLSSPDGAWGELDRALDFDERVPGWVDPRGIGSSIFTRFSSVYFYDEVDDLNVVFYLEVDPEAVVQLMDPEANAKQRTVTGSGTIVVQGRELRYIDYDASDDERNYFGRTIQVSEDDAPAGILVEFLREATKPRVTDADVLRELAPFHIGPDRTLVRRSQQGSTEGGAAGNGDAPGETDGAAPDGDAPDGSSPDGDSPDGNSPDGDPKK